MNRKTAVLACTLLLASALSCAHWSTKEWNSLENRHFAFTSFFCYSKRDKAAGIYSYMKKFPLQEAAGYLENIYSIGINTDEFTSFTSSGSPKDIKVKGLLFDAEFTWESRKKAPNTISFKYTKAMSEGVRGEDYIYSYELSIKTMDDTRARFTGEVNAREDIAPHLLNQLKRKAPMADKSKKPLREKKKEEKPEKEEEEKLDKILENLSPEERELLKKKLQK